ncbi:MAG: hypothetical protein AAF828_09640, partial [Bacteroidota bacterium]
MKSLLVLLPLLGCLTFLTGQRNEQLTTELAPFEMIKLFGRIDAELIRAEEEKIVVLTDNID